MIFLPLDDFDNRSKKVSRPNLNCAESSTEKAPGQEKDRIRTESQSLNEVLWACRRTPPNPASVKNGIWLGCNFFLSSSWWQNLCVCRGVRIRFGSFEQLNLHFWCLFFLFGTSYSTILGQQCWIRSVLRPLTNICPKIDANILSVPARLDLNFF